MWKDISYTQWHACHCWSLTRNRRCSCYQEGSLFNLMWYCWKMYNTAICWCLLEPNLWKCSLKPQNVSVTPSIAIIHFKHVQDTTQLFFFTFIGQLNLLLVWIWQCPVTFYTSLQTHTRSILLILLANVWLHLKYLYMLAGMMSV